MLKNHLQVIFTENNQVMERLTSSQFIRYMRNFTSRDNLSLNDYVNIYNDYMIQEGSMSKAEISIK